MMKGYNFNAYAKKNQTNLYMMGRLSEIRE